VDVEMRAKAAQDGGKTMVPRRGGQGSNAARRAKDTVVVAGGSSLERTEEVGKILFLMAEVARKNFGTVEMRAEALTAAYLALTGNRGLSASEMRAIRRELR
jgi:hypothetical protein